VIELQGRGVILGVCFGAKVAKEVVSGECLGGLFARGHRFFGGSDVGNYWG